MDKQLWVCGKQCIPHFLLFLFFIKEGNEVVPTNIFHPMETVSKYFFFTVDTNSVYVRPFSMHWQGQHSDLIQSLDKLKALNNHRATQLYLNTYVFRQNIDIKYLVQFYFIFFCAKHKKPVNMWFW